MWASTTSSRDNWERLVAAVIKRDQIRQLCHQDSITTVDSDFSEQNLSLSSVWSSPSQLPLTRDSAVDVRKSGSGTVTRKLFSALLWRKKSKGLLGIPVDEKDGFGLEIFSLRELLVATDHFSEKNIIGRGSFSEVYRGQFADGSLVAVVRLDAGARARAQIDVELEISSMVAHRNVIVVIGFCFSKKERLLIYPYMANGSVFQCLGERSASQTQLEWATRPRIALGVARGLAHLHHGCIRGIIHRGINAGNILLDDHFEAVVSNFTLAKFVDCNDVDDQIKGTYGHVAPEYVLTGKCSFKTDVYSYGFFLLELISGQSAYNLEQLARDDGMKLLDWLRRIYEGRRFEALIDQNDGGNCIEEVAKLLQIAMICTQRDPDERPTMSEVVMMLEDGNGLTEAWEEFLQNYSKTTSDVEWGTSDEDGISAISIT